MVQCIDKNGKLFVAAVSDSVTGFVCVWTKEEFGEHYAQPSKAGYISDVFVRDGYRRGIGCVFLRVAEEFLLNKGVTVVHLSMSTPRICL